ncbi:MAG: redox-sensing transcriptional repressor Rex [Firmicutes bacterium]|nr:redox-sensing transcriptional repressor Rex [Bacillota bacterium]HOB35564.1 redox-sensing transcriptional repressor Rex [Bacillota bacterium]HPZ91425.1 redox-sensing transcriptional repressor Rex [Bacillota bacterium]HQE02177.1 redox-sensing transcriptional repressor Rex [Bacillota bacterium]
MTEKKHRIPDVVIRRLPVYLRYLQQLMSYDVDTVSSQQMGHDLNLNPAQIRKDLSIFGDFGVKGMGYRVSELADKLSKILGLDKEIPIVLVGVGNLGAALCRYNRYQKSATKIVGLFDGHPAKIGQVHGSLEVRPMEELVDFVRQNNIKMAIITVPAAAAQSVCDALVAAGVKAILNFAPVLLNVPEGVRVQNSDVTVELQALAYYL